MILEVFLLDDPAKANAHAVVLARCENDTAIESLPINRALQDLLDYGRMLGSVIAGKSPRPPPNELEKYGIRLFEALFNGSILTLYNRLAADAVSIQILSDRADIREIPWEYMLTPNCRPAPHRNRSIVRVQVTCNGNTCPAPKQFDKKVNVLFVSADPVDQAGVSWEDVLATVNSSFTAQLGPGVSIKVIEGATRQALMHAIRAERFDVFHFFGHGDVRGGVGHLVLQDLKTGSSDFLSASDLAIAFAGTGVRLAILSACLSGAGKFSDDFGVLATALISTGIPAVVANQYPIPYKSISPFVASLYGSLIQQGDIDAAVAEGRAALAVMLNGPTGRDAVVEWGIPTLYRLANARQIFAP
ncbi:MAG: CHAT domain-containing protein [Steroidobacteraceae bacterium]